MRFPKRSHIIEPIDTPFGRISLYQFDDKTIALTLDDTVMSLVNVSNPQIIASPYIAEIATHIREDDTVIHLGVAGGTLASYIASRFNNVAQTGVEINASVVDVAREHLGLPRSPKLKVRIADAFTEIVSFPSNRASIIVVDVFDAHGHLDERIFDPSFLGNCLQALAPSGELCINVMDTFGNAKNVSKLKDSVKRVTEECPALDVKVWVTTPGKKHKPNALTNHLIWCKPMAP
ncbi:MAG: methyltransferase [Candidatus Ancillula sp.]|nr:methyltransferase [Candidatus Ancillula sp.]